MDQTCFAARAQVMAVELWEERIVILDEQLPDAEPEVIVPTAVENRIAKGIEGDGWFVHHDLHSRWITSVANPHAVTSTETTQRFEPVRDTAPELLVIRPFASFLRGALDD